MLGGGSCKVLNTEGALSRSLKCEYKDMRREETETGKNPDWMMSEAWICLRVLEFLQEECRSEEQVWKRDFK